MIARGGPRPHRHLKRRSNLRAPLGFDRFGESSRSLGRRVWGWRERVIVWTLKKLLGDEPDRPSQADIASELAMTENAVKQSFHRLRRRYRELLHEEISHTVIAPGDVEDELRHLVAVLRA